MAMRESQSGIGRGAHDPVLVQPGEETQPDSGRSQHFSASVLLLGNFKAAYQI